MKKYLAFVCLLAIVACNKNTTQTQDVTIITTNSAITYKVEVAKTPQQLQKGLMYRESLDKDAGMLFLFNPVKPVAMWMKNTKISLDMLFINKENKIVCIKENATPMSEDFIVCDKEVNAVIELNAGEIAKNNILINDRVTY